MEITKYLNFEPRFDGVFSRITYSKKLGVCDKPR